jgi:hypothetical protein
MPAHRYGALPQKYWAFAAALEPLMHHLEA